MSYPNDENLVSKDIVNALLEVVNEDDLKAKKTKKKTPILKKDIVKTFNNICKFMCGIENVTYKEEDKGFDRTPIERYFCYYSVKTNEFEFLVNVALMNIITEMMIDEEDCFLTRNVIDDFSIDGARVIFETLLKELGFEEQIDNGIEVKIKSDYNLKGNKTFYEFKINEFNGLVCIKTKKTKNKNKSKKDVK